MPHRPRHALLIGNGAYADAPLRNPVNDARAMTAALRRLGFDAMLRTDVTKRALDEAVRAFVPTLRPDGVVVAFFAGHGLQHDGESYLLPVDADIDRDVDIPYEAYPAQRLVDAVAQSGVRLSVIVLDACRANAVRVARAAGVAGLAPLSTVSFRSVRRRPQDYAIVYATEPGDVAADSGGGRHSPFTEALIASLRVPGLSLDEVMHRTTGAVHRATGYEQRPVAHMSLTGRHVLHPDGGGTAGASDQAVVRPPANPKPQPPHVRPRPRPASSDTASVDLEDWLRLTANEAGSKAAGSSGWTSASGGSATASAGGTTVSTGGGGPSVSVTSGSVSVGSTGGGVSVTVNGVPVHFSDATSGGREPTDVTVAHMARVLAESMRNGADSERVADGLREFDDDTLSAVLDHLPNDLYLALENLLFEPVQRSEGAAEERRLADRLYDRLAHATTSMVRSGGDLERLAEHLLELDEDGVTEVLDRLSDDVRAELEEFLFDESGSPE